MLEFNNNNEINGGNQDNKNFVTYKPGVLSPDYQKKVQEQEENDEKAAKELLTQLTTWETWLNTYHDDKEKRNEKLLEGREEEPGTRVTWVISKVNGSYNTKTPWNLDYHYEMVVDSDPTKVIPISSGTEFTVWQKVSYIKYKKETPTSKEYQEKYNLRFLESSLKHAIEQNKSEEEINEIQDDIKKVKMYTDYIFVTALYWKNEKYEKGCLLNELEHQNKM